jgi:RNA-directed DNA polymerase
MLSNLAMRAFDRQVTEFCLDQGLAYTRYADDLIFSTSDPMFDRKSAESLVRSISDLILKYGLRPRATKTVIAPPGARKVVLGLVVNSARPTLSRELKGHIEAHVHHIVTKTPVIHAQVRGFESVFAMQQYIEGMLNFAGQVDAKFANPLRERLRAVRWPI